MEQQGNLAKQETVFQDVFRKADSNDDGAISWDEFKAFFKDAVSSTEDLEILFHEIDTHKSNNVDVGELCDFFKKHLGPFAEIFNSLDDLGTAVTRSLLKCHQSYATSSATEKFSMRFLLREVVRQFGFLQHHLETASDKIEEDERNKMPIIVEAEPESEASGRGGRMMRKMKSYEQQTSFQGSHHALEAEVDRLADLIDRLDGKVRFDIVEQEIVDHNTDEPVELVCRKFILESTAIEDFNSSLRSYTLAVKTNTDCLGVSVQVFADQGRCILYEIWRNNSQLSKHLMSADFKTFQRQLIDCLVQPEDFSKMPLPASWWKKQKKETAM